MTKRVLTGITTTGTPHLGNYVGAIRPAIEASRDRNVESYYVLADYHALIKCQEPARVAQSTLEIAASWLACGLDTDRVFFYRQSDVPEVTELTWLLTCVTAKGLLNRAHAYKAAVDANLQAGEDPDAGVSAGLYMYPVLMAADILLFNAHQVPVGRDQVQHIEIARDIAQRFNHLYGEHFTLPEAAIEERTALLPGLDGRKMSKSYDNTIPLWLPREQLRKAILGIVTNSQPPGEPKDPAQSHLFTIFQAFATPGETEALRRDYAAGIAWGDAKQRVFERIDAELHEARAKYESLVAAPERIEKALKEGAAKARQKAQSLLSKLRDAVGLRPLTGAAMQHAASSAMTNAAGPQVHGPYKDGAQFKFRFEDGDGTKLFESAGFASGRDAGAAIKRLKATPAAQLVTRTTSESGEAHVVSLAVEAAADEPIAWLHIPPGVEPTALLARVKAAIAAWQAGD
ncbi:MAG TPA: tryptophan--tRNA ligase [Xanthomonadales bacterium]|nr:tryptophan--tRNA ligase [Xanthomonadales bacterium]